MCKHAILLLCLLCSVITIQAQTISHYEYWLDGDYQSRVTASSSEINVNISLPLDGQPSGLHFFNFRAFNSNDEVSNIYRTLFYLPNKDIVDVAGYEYWIDDDSLNRVTCASSQPVLLLEIDLSSLNEGVHTFSFRAKNSFDNWGSVFSEEFEVMTATSVRQTEKESGTFDVYNLTGEKVLDNANRSDLSSLPHSIYVIQGRKVLIK